MIKSRIKKSLAFVLSLIIVFSVCSIGTFAEQKAAPLFTMSDVNERQGDEFDVVIKFAQDIAPDGINISALDVSLHYNKDAFSVVKVVKGEGLNEALERLSGGNKLHLETGDYIFGSSFKKEGTVNWSLSTIDGFTFKKGTDFAVVTFKANDFADVEDDLSMICEVTNAADKAFNNTTALYTPETNTVKLDVNLATLCSWDYNALTKTYSLKKLNDKSAKSFTIPDEYSEDPEEKEACPVTYILSSAFSSCTDLENVVIGSNMKNILFAAFYGCKNLKKITVYSDDVNIASTAFFGANTDKLVIRCRKDSTADKFAKSKNIAVEYFQDISSCVFKGIDEEKYYTGMPVELSDFEVFNSYNTKLRLGKDYNFEYENNVDISKEDSKAVIHVYGAGEYWGTKDIYFNVLCPYHTDESEYYSVTQVYGNCEEGGKVVKTCSFCGYHDESETLPPKDHCELEWINKIEPTCKDEGLRVFGCKDCSYYDEEKTEPIPVTDHNKQWVTITEPTCKDKGHKVYQCLDCLEIFDEEDIECVDHSCDWVETKPATCLTDGEESFVCKWCGKVVETRPIKCPGKHIASSEWVTVTPATCTKDGIKKLYCAKCNKELDTDIIPATGHVAPTEIITTPATCEVDGKIETVCTECKVVLKTEVIKATGHKKAEWGVIEEPTCTKDGKEGVVCTKCGKEFESKIIPHLEHEPTDDYVITVKPTCMKDGKEAIVCKHCGAEKIYSERTVKATGHNYDFVITKEPTCTETGIETKQCLNCGDVLYSRTVKAIGHSYGEWEIEVAPTCTKDGYEKRTCAHCGDVDLRNAPATGHSPVWIYAVRPSYKLPGTEKKVCEHCGYEYGQTRPCDKLYPDVDLNGRLSSLDALMVLQQATEFISLEGQSLKNADCNGDGKINSTDALLVLQLATGVIKA